MNKDEHYQIFLQEVQARKQNLADRLRDFLKPTQAFKTLEIGSGHGDFLVQYATTYPERFCLGIDLITQRIEKSNKKARRANVAQCFFLKARAEEFLESQPAEFLWDEIFVLYPDPWPKKRHHKNRLFQVEFLDRLALRVSLGAKIHFETDAKDYFDEVCGRMEVHPRWRKLEGRIYAIDTVFSRITGQQGHHAVFECCEACPADPISS